MSESENARRSTAENIFALVERGRVRQASDLHIEPGQGAAYRIFTQIDRIHGETPDASGVDAFLDETVDRVSRARLEKLGVADAVYADERIGSIRIHATRGKTGARLAIRLLARSIPLLETLGLPPAIERLAELPSGLALIAGPSGSGKSTTAASLLDRINATSRRHILTFEDPIEYRHGWLKSAITQYEIGRDVATFAEGIRGALRADPDVIFIGELRGIESVTACLQAAETGHLVFAALHTPSETPYAINRLSGLFGAAEQDAARHRLADTIRALVGLRLLPLRDGAGLRVAAEIMIATDAVKRLIREGATHQLRATMAAGRRDGSQTLEAHLCELVSAGEVDLAVARAVSSYPDDVRDFAPATMQPR